MLGIDSPAQLNQYHQAMSIDGFSSSHFLESKALPMEKQLRHPQFVLSSVATVITLVHALAISWINYNHHPN